MCELAALPGVKRKTPNHKRLQSANVFMNSSVEGSNEKIKLSEHGFEGTQYCPLAFRKVIRDSRMPW